MTTAASTAVCRPHRPWYRLYFWTYFVLLFCAAFFVLANVPGERRGITHEELVLDSRQIDAGAIENFHKMPALKKLRINYWKGPRTAAVAAVTVRSALPKLEVQALGDRW